FRRHLWGNAQYVRAGQAARKAGQLQDARAAEEDAVLLRRCTKILKSSAKRDDSAQAKAERKKKALEVLNQKEFQELQKEMHKISETLRTFRRPPMYQGHVWLYLRKPPANPGRQ